MPTPDEVLGFWFDPAAEVHWFDRDNAFDAHVRERFGATLKAAADDELDGWSATPEGWLALLIVLDQFSRNIYRDDARAWAYDAKAQALALAGIARGDECALCRILLGRSGTELPQADRPAVIASRWPRGAARCARSRLLVRREGSREVWPMEAHRLRSAVDRLVHALLAALPVSGCANALLVDAAFIA